MEKIKRRHQRVLKGATILAIAGVIAKILSAVYRVPFQNLVGDTGFYVYQQVYPLYGIGMTFALSGLPNFIGYQIAWQQKLENRRLLVKRYTLLMCLFALLCFAIVYFGAGSIAIKMGDPLLSPVVRSVSWMFLFMPILMLLRGAFQSRNDMRQTAISQVVEQCVRVSVILWVAYHFASTPFQEGPTAIYQMGMRAMSSAWIAAGCASVTLLYAFIRSKGVQRLFSQWHLERKEKIPNPITWQSLLKKFFTEALVLCFFSALLVFFQLVDSFSVYEGLVKSGVGEEIAKMVKGVYDRGQPFVQLGMVLSTAFSASYLPMLTHAFVRREQEQFTHYSRAYIRLTVFGSALITAGLISIMPQLNHLLFSNREGSGVLSHYVIMITLASTIIAFQNIMQAQGRWIHGGIAFVIGMMTKILLNTRFTEWLGTYGSAWATNIALFLVLLYLFVQLNDKLKASLSLCHLLSDVGSICVGMIVEIRLLSWLWDHFVQITRLTDALFVGISIIIGTISVLILLKYRSVLTIEEWREVPLGDKIIKKIRK